MAATVTIIRKIPIGQTESVYLGEILMDSSYATGGEPIDFVASPGGLVGPSKMHTLFPAQVGGYIAEFVRSSQKLKMYRDNGTAAAAALPEVASAVDLSAVVIPFVGFGSS